MLNASQSQMKRADLSAESTNSTPPLTAELFATTPTGRPSIRANPVITSGANSGLVSKNESASMRPSMMSCMSNGTDSSAGTQSSANSTAASSAATSGAGSRQQVGR